MANKATYSMQSKKNKSDSPKDAAQRPKNGASRQATFRARQRQLGRGRHEFWLTPDELRRVQLVVRRLRQK